MEKFIKFMMWSLAFCVVIVLLGRALLFESWVVPDDPYLVASILPTLKPGDHLLILTRGAAGFGDLVRCPDPDDPSRFVVGRVIGEGGDFVQLKGSELRINGTRYVASEACKERKFSFPHPDSGNDTPMHCSRVDLSGDWHFVARSSKPVTGNDVSKQVGTENYFLLSDNRTYHEDSRDFGTIPAISCQQRVFFRLWGAEGWSDVESRLTFIR